MCKGWKKLIRLLVVVSAVYALFPKTAHAYLDPGSANYMLQMIIAVTLSAAFVVKSYWAKLKAFLRGEKQQEPHEKEGDSPSGGVSAH